MDVKVAMIGLAIAVAVALVSWAGKGARPKFDPFPPRFEKLGWGVQGLALLAAAGLFVTGLMMAAAIDHGRAAGFPLLAHVALGVAVLALAPVLALLRGEQHAQAKTFSLVRKAGFWFFLAMTLACGLTVLAVASPVVGVARVGECLALHRWAGLLATMAATCLALGR